MKKTITLLAIAMLGIIALPRVYSQCTPGDENSCPDPENNGQICPEELPDGVVQQLYSQEFTILPPSQYLVDTVNNIYVDLHHIRLAAINNLPPGIGWVSNAPDSIFMAGTYYCVLLEGIPETEGTYPLKIDIEVYIPGILGSPPIYVGTVTDSASLAITVNGAAGIGDKTGHSTGILSATYHAGQGLVYARIRSAEAEKATLNLITITGSRVAEKEVSLHYGINDILLPATGLKEGIYFLQLSGQNHAAAFKFIY
ncbi:MAG: hypothetical protein Kow00127_02720 [Bacteroidales bacterium]